MIVECVICQETGLFKSSVTCNICKCKICRPCLLKMKSLKKRYLRLCPQCRGEQTLMYNNGKMAFNDEEDFETFYRQQRIHIILTVPKVIMSWLLFFFWLYCLSCLFFAQENLLKEYSVVNVPLFSVCLLALVHFYCCG